MAITESDTHIYSEDTPAGAADFRDVLLPIGLAQDIPRDFPDAQVLQADAAQLAATFQDTVATLLNVPSGEVTNHYIELTGETSLQGHPAGHPTKREQLQLGAMQLYRPGTTEPDGMQYTMQRTTSINGSQAIEVATVSLPDSGDPYVTLERRSTRHGVTDAQDIFYPNTHLTLVGVQEMFADLQQAVERRDAGLEITRVAPLRTVETDGDPRVTNTAVRAGESVPLTNAAIRLAATNATAVFQELPRGSVELEGPDGTYQIQTLADQTPSQTTEVRLSKRTPRGVQQWAGISVPHRPDSPASIVFSVQRPPTQEARALNTPYPRSGLQSDYGQNSPQAIQGGLDLAREIHSGMQQGRIRRKVR